MHECFLKYSFIGVDEIPLTHDCGIISRVTNMIICHHILYLAWHIIVKTLNINIYCHIFITIENLWIHWQLKNVFTATIIVTNKHLKMQFAQLISHNIYYWILYMNFAYKTADKLILIKFHFF